jgi:hypothetical protein
MYGLGTDEGGRAGVGAVVGVRLAFVTASSKDMKKENEGYVKS